MATIIRNNSSSETSSGRPVRPVAFNFEDMNDRANEYLETVRREAAKIVQHAHQQAEQVRRQAEAAGRVAAEEAAERALESKIASRMASLFTALDQLVVETTTAQAEWIARWEKSAVGVASAIAERIIRRELERKPEISLEWIHEALRLAAGAADVTLHLNPADHEFLGTQAEQLAQSLGQLGAINVVADPAITAGGCVVQTRLGRIDQQIEAQLVRIQDELS